jgi:Ras-related protein Rab-1A
VLEALGGCMVKEREFIFKVAMLGDSGVGKRTLAKLATVNVLDDKFLDDYGVVMTYYNVRASGVTDVINAHFSIWDISGLLDVGGLRNKYEYGARGLIAVADASRQSTVENIDSWMANVKDSLGDVDIVLVLNKIDLVTKEELDRIKNIMKEYAEKYDGELFLTSCIDKINVQEPFLEISKKLCSTVIGEVGTITTIKPKDRSKKSRFIKK